MEFVRRYLAEAKQIIDGLDAPAIERVATLLADTRAGGGRLFVLGVGARVDAAYGNDHAGVVFHKS